MTHKFIEYAPLTVADFARHAGLFGVQDAALAVRERFGPCSLERAQRLMRAAMFGKRVAFKIGGGLWQWQIVNRREQQ